MAGAAASAVACGHSRQEAVFILLAYNGEAAAGSEATETVLVVNNVGHILASDAMTEAEAEKDAPCKPAQPQERLHCNPAAQRGQQPCSPAAVTARQGQLSEVVSNFR